MRHLAAAALLLALPATVTAQQHGIWAHNGSSTYSGVLCGFDCSSAGNSAQINVRTSDANGRPNAFGVSVSGRKDDFAILAMALGAVRTCATGISLPGIKNRLLLAPRTYILGAGRLSSAYRGCGGGTAALLPVLRLPGSVFGVTATFQGVVSDDSDGATAFTRAIQVTFN